MTQTVWARNLASTSCSFLWVAISSFKSAICSEVIITIVSLAIMRELVIEHKYTRLAVMVRFWDAHICLNSHKCWQ